MLKLTPDLIRHWHAELADYPEIQRSLQAIEDCDGDVEDAAITLAIQADLEPDNSDRWLASFAKRYRPVICETTFRSQTESQGDQGIGQLGVSAIVRHLAAASTCPPLLILPVAVFVATEGFGPFCSAFAPP
jgi:hypothetical protein